MTIAQQLTDIAAAKEATRAAIVGKGVTLPAGSGLTAFPAAVDAIPSGGADVTGMTDGTATVIDWSSAGDTGSIRIYAFYSCTALTALTLPPGMTGIIGDSAFYQCKSLTALTLPPGMTGSIGASAFRGCTSLTALTLPPGMTGSIGSYTFQECTSLTSLVIPPGITGSIGTYAFQKSSSLTSLVIQTPTVMTLANTSAFSFTTCNIYVPDALVATYQAATNWSTLADRIKPISEL